MLAILGWLSGSTIGRYLVAGALTAAALAVLALRLMSIGAARERAKQTQATLNSIAQKVRVDEEIAGMSHADRVAKLREWERG